MRSLRYVMEVSRYVMEIPPVFLPSAGIGKQKNRFLRSIFGTAVKQAAKRTLNPLDSLSFH